MKFKFHYAWVILFITFLTILAVQGIRLSFGAFIEPWEKDFNMDRGTISLISTLSFIVYGLSQPLIGKLVDRLGVRVILSFSTLLVGISILLCNWATSPWQLFILYGIIVSLGVGGASNVAASVAVTNWFTRKRGLAFGIMEAGFGAGQLILVPASLFLISMYDWQMTVISLGVFLMLFVFPIGLLFLRNKPADKNLKPIGGNHFDEEKEDQHSLEKSKPSFWPILKKRHFWFLLLPFFICGYTTTGLMDTHLIPFAQLCGFTPTEIGTAVSLLAAFNIIGTLISGVIADKWSNRKFLTYLYIGRTLTLILLAIFISNLEFLTFFVNNPSLLIIFAISFGVVDFATVAPTQMLATQFFNRQLLGLMLGWLFFSHQLGSALGAYLPGLLFNITGNYNMAFYSAIILLIGAALMCVMLPEPEKVKREPNLSTNQITS
ncbi:putative MFS-type transporter YbfB [Robertmurraya siralis]|uniref:MFS-type transporter YbfB n=1 Tax=Robertmurraya siralis TaxID=77777 RepID=A0A919WIN1_9BACI|nr:MFS transporter [Robertmurraya siralis]GIN62454.1 putative MFS-type transporter YbfB [Robertmurraya siralis]